MVTVFAEGVDYSSTGTSNWEYLANELKAAGKDFVGRYAVTDKSPGGRGITAAEYQVMRAAGIEVFVYWEAQTSWMLGGWDAGVRAARDAVKNLQAAGMPTTMPVYYSHDIEPDPSHYAAVDECLRGAASVVQIQSVGLYGGWGVIDHVSRTKTAPWLCQTYAWSGGRLHPDAHLHQYNNYGNYIAGTDVDLVAALKPHYGQASDFVGKPKPPAKPVYAQRFPPALRKNDPYTHRDKDGILWIELTPRTWIAKDKTERRQRAKDDAPEVGPSIEKGDKVTFVYAVHMPDGTAWFISRGGSRARADAFI